MICLTPKPIQKKISEIIRLSLWLSSNPDLNCLDYAIWNVLENKTNAISHSDIRSLKTAIEKERNKIYDWIYFEGVLIE